MLDDDSLGEIADRLVRVRGIVAVTLGGSRAGGHHTAASDVDLGLYYEHSIDLEALTKLAQELGGAPAAVTAPGAWGPWVDGGGWLTIAGEAVDWIYRDLARVGESVTAAELGRTTRHYQLGHPFGIPEYAYAAEVAQGRALADPANRIAALTARLQEYPSRLRDALVGDLSDADFNIAIARKAAPRRDALYVSGCLFQALVIASNAIHAAAGKWLTNEKGAIALAGALQPAPDGFAERAALIAGRLGTTEDELERSIDAAAALVSETRASIAAYVS